MMMDEALRMLIEFLEAASPAVWQAAMRQVQADIVARWVWLGIAVAGFLTLLVIAILATAQFARDDDDGDLAGPVLFVWGVTMGLFFVCGGLITTQIKMLNNPIWYAILKLRYLVSN